MKLLITGASGFIGSSIVSRIPKAFETIALTRTQENLETLITKNSAIRFQLASLEDVESLDFIKSFNPEVVLHLAWSGLPDYSLANNTRNFMAHMNLFETLKNCEGLKRIVFAGSCWEYGPVKGPVSEAHVTLPTNLFATFKNSIREIAFEFFRGTSVQIIWGRVFFSYGVRQRPQSLIPSLVNALRNGEIPSIKSPNAVNDFIHVDDVAEAFISLVRSENLEQGIFNIGSGRPRSVAEIANLVARQLGSSFYLPEPKIDLKRAEGFWADISKIQNSTKWAPKLNIETGIQDFFNC